MAVACRARECGWELQERRRQVPELVRSMVAALAGLMSWGRHLIGWFHWSSEPLLA